MGYRQSFLLIIGTAVVFAVWELIGHLFLMAVPMEVRHILSTAIGTGLALLIATVAIQAIWRQQQELRELAHLRDYLLRMQAHSLHLSPEARIDPRQQLEYRSLELKYADIQQQLASERPEMQARALLDLQGLAQMRLTGLRESYPFFSRAVSHLTAALCLETDLPSRNQALHALRALVVFTNDTEPRLLLPLIEELAHANRTALIALTNGLAERFAPAETVTSDDFHLLLPLVRFTDSEETDKGVLHELFESPSCQEVLTAYRVLQQAGKAQNPDDVSVLNAIHAAAVRLRDTRDVLAQALLILPTPDDFPLDPAARRYWKRTQLLSLQGCFLVGAELNKAQLQGIDLQHAALQAATLTDAQLQNADLTGANLWKAQLFVAGLENAKLWGTNLRDASLPSAHMEGADLSRAQLQGAHLIGAHLKDACLWKIAIADDERKREHCAVFTDANWWEARFTDILSGSTDREAYTWLQFTFPQPVPEATAPPEISGLRSTATPLARS